LRIAAGDGQRTTGRVKKRSDRRQARDLAASPTRLFQQIISISLQSVSRERAKPSPGSSRASPVGSGSFDGTHAPDWPDDRGRNREADLILDCIAFNCA